MGNLVKLKCDYCDSEIERTKESIRKRKYRGYKSNYCNNSCQGKHRSEKKRKEILERGVQECSVCHEEKNLEEFNKNKVKSSGYNTICRKCSKKRSRAYYKRNSDIHKENVAKRNKKVRRESVIKVLKYLKKNPCIDCGETRFPTLQFDHRDNVDKVKDISKLVAQGYKWETIKKEIGKCDVRCANCHSIRTSKQQSWYKDIDLDKILASTPSD